MPTVAARRVDISVEKPPLVFISGHLPLFTGGPYNVESGDLTVTCPNCRVVLLDSVEIERFARYVFVCPVCKTYCDRRWRYPPSVLSHKQPDNGEGRKRKAEGSKYLRLPPSAFCLHRCRPISETQH
jgi:hypothetical protein